MKKFLGVLLTLCICLGICAPVLDGIEASAVSANIDMISTNPAENCSTAMNINFHTPLSYTGCYVQYTTADDTSWTKAKTQSGSYTSYGTGSNNPFYGKSAKKDDGSDWTQTTVTFLDYNVTLSNLTPDTNYMYRIYDGSDYSNVYKFKTAANDASEWSFLVTGDFHEYYKNYGVHRAAQATKGVNAGISLAGQLGWSPVEHIVSVGDIVAWGVDYNQWTNVMDQSYIKNYSFANCIGNHDDMDRSSNSSSQYNSIVFNNPRNGYNSGYEMGTVFYYIYNNVLFIYVNYLKASVAAQETWAQGVIDKMKGQYQYAVLVNHRPATNKYTGGTYSYFWSYWADFCDKNHIDLVLAGDHHVYMRSQPLYNGSKVSNYSASNPNGTVYLAADSADGERGSSTDVTSSFNSSIVASHYYRYEYSGSTSDITSMIIRVTPEKMTTEFVYYETSSSASHPSFRVGAVNGHSSFYYGDTSYVYPSDHGYTGEIPPSDDPGTDTDNNGLPLAKTNFLSAGQYKYSTSVYPGGASYYSYEYYGDNSSQGGSFMTGKLNDGVYPASSNPGSSNAGWATFFLSQGEPQVTLKLSQSAYINKINLVYRNDGNFYGDALINAVSVSDVDSGYVTTIDYTSSISEVDTSNYMLTLTFTKAVKASYVNILFTKPGSPATRLALGEIEVWGDTKLPETKKPFELTEESKYTLDESYVVAKGLTVNVATVTEQFKCDVSVLDLGGKKADSGVYVGTGFKVVQYNSSGEAENTVVIIIKGDLTGDGSLNSTDTLAAEKIINGSATGTDVQIKAADLTGDAIASSADMLIMEGHCSGAAPLE